MININFIDDLKRRNHVSKEEVEKFITLLSEHKRDMMIALILTSQDEIETKHGVYRYEKSKMVASVIFPIYYAIIRQSNTILEMSKIESSSLIDCLPITRGIIESCINAVYIMAVGEKAAENSINHALAKSHHNLDRKSGNGYHSMRIRRVVPLKFNKNFNDILTTFTSKKMRPKNWTDLSVTQRIDEIGKHFKKRVSINLNAAYLNIYGDASEIIHGSYLGALLSQGREPFSEPTKNLEEIQKYSLTCYLNCLHASIMAINATLTAHDQYCNFDNKVIDTDKLYSDFTNEISSLYKVTL